MSRFRHDARNRLNVACLGLQLIQKRIDAGRVTDIESLIKHTMGAFQAINDELAASKKASLGSVEHAPQVLIVEDNANEGQLLAELLGPGYRVSAPGMHSCCLV